MITCIAAVGMSGIDVMREYLEFEITFLKKKEPDKTGEKNNK